MGARPVVVAGEIRREFKIQMARMIGLKFAPADMTTHWEALSDVPLDMLKVAIDRAQRECQEFPSPAVLRGFVDQERRRTPAEPEPDRSAPLAQPKQITVPGSGTVIPVTRTWSYYCESCNDLGWLSLWCGERTYAKPWMESADCGRYHAHGAHEWTKKCPCFDSNPDVQRRLERQRQTARRSEKE